MKDIYKLSPWIKLLVSALLPISYDFFHVSFYSFIVIFIAIDIVMITFDIWLNSKLKRKMSMDAIFIYIFYNWIAARIIYYF